MAKIVDLLKEKKLSYDEIVYIGDGISDVCVAEYADRCYAKSGTYLEKSLEERGIEFRSFETFEDIMKIEDEKV